ncbi:MAG: FkbM family methyltransferase [Planctomycetaceae bacterium]
MLNWFRYQYRKLTRPRVITNGGVQLDLGPVAGTRYARSFYRDQHERDERAIIDRHLESTDTVLELGAGIGLVTILCCQRIGSSRVHAFEANRQLESALRRNFELNGVNPRLDLRMVSLQSGPQDFYVSDRFILSSSSPSAAGGGSRRTQVDSVPLANVLAETQPTFLIVDIEGGEQDLADPSITLRGVRKLCIEMHPHVIGEAGVSQVIAALCRQGFTCCEGETRGSVMYFERPATSDKATVSVASQVA